jgi:hypothetical protein
MDGRSYSSVLRSRVVDGRFSLSMGGRCSRRVVCYAGVGKGGGLWGEMGESGENEPRQTSWLVFCDLSPPMNGVVGVPMAYCRSYAGVGLSSPWRGSLRWRWVEKSVRWKE